MQVKLLSVEPPDSRHKDNVIAVGTVEFILDSGESIIVTDYRLLRNSRPGPNWVAPPTRLGPTSRIPIVMTTRKVLRQVEDLIMDEYERRQHAEYAEWEAGQNGSESQAKLQNAQNTEVK